MLTTTALYTNFHRNLLQRHHVHGGELSGDHHHGPQLSPQDGGDTRYAGHGQDHLPPVGAMDHEDAQAGGDHQQDHHPGPEEDEGAG